MSVIDASRTVGRTRLSFASEAEIDTFLGALERFERGELTSDQWRGLGRLLGEHLRADPALVAAATDLQVKISGCPNGCGQHHIAGIGLQGGVRKLDGRAVPQYFVLVGDTGARFGRLAAKVPARRAPEALERLIALYAAAREPGESASAFFGRVDLDRVKAALADLERLRLAEARPEDFVDLGEDTEFAPEVQVGECALMTR